VKVAQYEVLGNGAKRHAVPDGTIETFGFWARTPLSDCQHWSIVPSGTDRSLKTLTQHFVLGYFREVPAGLIFSNHQPRSRSRPLKLTRMGNRRIQLADVAQCELKTSWGCVG
jgi:hypothetical protein